MGPNLDTKFDLLELVKRLSPAIHRHYPGIEVYLSLKEGSIVVTRTIKDGNILCERECSYKLNERGQLTVDPKDGQFLDVIRDVDRIPSTRLQEYIVEFELRSHVLDQKSNEELAQMILLFEKLSVDISGRFDSTTGILITSQEGVRAAIEKVLSKIKEEAKSWIIQDYVKLIEDFISNRPIGMLTPMLQSTSRELWKLYVQGEVCGSQRELEFAQYEQLRDDFQLNQLGSVVVALKRELGRESVDKEALIHLLSAPQLTEFKVTQNGEPALVESIYLSRELSDLTARRFKEDGDLKIVEGYSELLFEYYKWRKLYSLYHVVPCEKVPMDSEYNTLRYLRGECTEDATKILRERNSFFGTTTEFILCAFGGDATAQKLLEPREFSLPFFEIPGDLLKDATTLEGKSLFDPDKKIGLYHSTGLTFMEEIIYQRNGKIFGIFDQKGRLDGFTIILPDEELIPHEYKERIQLLRGELIPETALASWIEVVVIDSDARDRINRSGCVELFSAAFRHEIGTLVWKEVITGVPHEFTDEVWTTAMVGIENERAQNRYRKDGWIITDIVVEEHGSQYYLMAKRLLAGAPRVVELMKQGE